MRGDWVAGCSYFGGYEVVAGAYFDVCLTATDSLAVERSGCEELSLVHAGGCRALACRLRLHA